MADREANVRALAIAIFAANGRLISAGNETVAHLDLTSARWQVLSALHYASHPLPTASIARNMGLTRQAVQRIVDLLADRGLVTFQRNPHHRRAKLVVLTDAGAEAVIAAERAIAPIDRAISNAVGDARIREAIETLNAMIAAISQEIDCDPGAADDSTDMQKDMMR